MAFFSDSSVKIIFALHSTFWHSDVTLSPIKVIVKKNINMFQIITLFLSLFLSLILTLSHDALSKFMLLYLNEVLFDGCSYGPQLRQA